MDLNPFICDCISSFHTLTSMLNGFMKNSSISHAVDDVVDLLILPMSLIY